MASWCGKSGYSWSTGWAWRQPILPSTTCRHHKWRMSCKRPRWSLERWSGDLCAQTGSWSGHNCPICQDTGGLPVRSAWCWAAWCSRPGVGAHRGLSEGGGQQDAERKTGLKVDTNFRVTRNLSSPSALLFGLRGGVIVQPLEEGEIFFVPVTS